MCNLFQGAANERVRELEARYDELEERLDRQKEENRALLDNKKLLEKSLAFANDKASKLNTELHELKGSINHPSPPKILGRTSGYAISLKYREIFGEGHGIYVGDEMKDVTTIDEIKRFVAWSKVDRLPYISDTEPSSHDCDRFATGLCGEFANAPGWWDLPTFVIWSNYAGGHGFFTCLAYPSEDDLTLTAYYIEPQTDGLLPAKQVEQSQLWLIVGRKVGK